MLAIETINQCNFKCYFCPAGNVKDKLELITLENIKNIIPHIIKLDINTIKLTPSRGEFFLHPEAYKILKALSDVDCIKNIHFHTNLELINIDEIYSHNIDVNKIFLMVSHYGVDGVDDFIFQTKKSEKEYLKVQENIKKLELSNLCFEIQPRPKNYDYDLPTVDRLHNYKFSGVCWNMWMPRISSNGDFVYCTCSETYYPNSAIIGNIFKNSLYDLYTHKKRYEIYSNMKNSKYPEMCKICKSFRQNRNVNLSSYKNMTICKNKG